MGGRCDTALRGILVTTARSSMGNIFRSINQGHSLTFNKLYHILTVLNYQVCSNDVPNLIFNPFHSG